MLSSARRPRASRGPRRRTPSGAQILVLGWALLLISWAGGQPPGAAPDEAAHLVKALGTATGQGLGAVPDVPLPQENAFLSTFVRQYDLPDGWRIDVRPPCYVSTPAGPGTDASCLRAGASPRRSFQDEDGVVLGRERAGTGLTYVAPYPPLPYVLPGALARLAPDPAVAAYAARGGAGLMVLALLALSARAATTRRAVLGLAVAVTPMAVFLGASTTSSGIVTAAAVCAAAGGGLLSRSAAPSGPGAVTGAAAEARLGWVALGVGTAVMSLSRPEGPVLAVPVVVSVLLLLGRGGVRAAWAASPRAAALASAAGSASLAAGVAWALLVLPRLPTVDDAGGSFSEGEASTPVLTAAVRELRGLPSEVVSATGWRDVPFPKWLAGAWLLLAIVVTLVAITRVLGARRRTALLLLAAAGPTAFTIGAVVVLNPVGASAQGRYVLPLLAASVVLATSVVSHRGGGEARVPPDATRGARWHRTVAAHGLVAAAVLFAGHVTARYLDARRYAVGPDVGGAAWLLDAPWQPVGGAWPWLLAGVAGAGLVAAAPLVRRGTRGTARLAR